MNRITPQDVGRRVSVRRALPDAAPGRRFTDVVGELTAYADGLLTITRRDGSVARVAEGDVVAAKTVPAPPARGPAAVSPERMQEIAAAAWPAPETATLGAWLLRAAGGFTRRANSALAAGDPGVPAGEALAAIRRWYAERGLPALVQVLPGSDADRAAEAAGWPAEGESLVLTGRLAAVADRTAPWAATAGTVRVTEEPDETWLSAYRGGALEETARRVLAGPPGTLFALVPAPEGRRVRAGTVAAIGRCAVAGRYAGFAAVEVDPAFRRSGLARAVMRALTERALAAGATTGWLQVEADNAPALALYEGLGFTVHHAYHYRRAPGGAE